MAKVKRVNNLVVVSDLHCGCKLGLYPPVPVAMLEASPNSWQQSRLQKKLWSLWDEFWNEFVPWATHGEPYAIAINGDAVDGVHHKSTTPVSHNLEDQAKIALAVLEPIRAKAAHDLFFMVRGTEAHTGPSGAQEEGLARSLCAVKDEDGLYSNFALKLELGEQGRCLIHLAHTIGTTGSVAAETTAPMKELADAWSEAGQWGTRAFNVVGRSHRHRHVEARKTCATGYGYSFVTAGWQLKTPFAFKIAGARQRPPEIGGCIIRQGDRDYFTLHKVTPVEQTKVVQI